MKRSCFKALGWGVILSFLVLLVFMGCGAGVGHDDAPHDTSSNDNIGLTGSNVKFLFGYTDDAYLDMELYPSADWTFNLDDVEHCRSTCYHARIFLTKKLFLQSLSYCGMIGLIMKA